MAPPPAPPAPAAPAAPAGPAAPNVLDNLVASMGLSQLLMVGGALVLVGIEVILGMLIGEFTLTDAIWFGAVVIVLGLAASRWAPALLPFSYRNVLLVGGLIIAIVGADRIVFNLLSLGRAPSAWNATELLGLVLYVGSVIAVAWGTWLMLRARA
jgi:hypothetical protein